MLTSTDVRIELQETLEGIGFEFSEVDETTKLQQIMDAFDKIEIRDKPAHPSQMLYVDDDGYVCFKDQHNLPGVGILWTLHDGGWEAFVNAPGQEEPIYTTNDIVFPSDDELGEAVEEYEGRLRG